MSARTRLALLGTGLLTAGAIVACYRRNRSTDAVEAKFTNENSNFQNCSGTRVHYRDTGDGPPLLLLHGAGSSLHTWSGWVEHLQNSFRLIRLDLPGFGLSDPMPNDQYSPDQYVQFLNNFLGTLNVKTTRIAGSSFGARLALRYGLKHPEKLERIIVLNSTGLEQNGSFPSSLVNLPLPELTFRFSPRVLVSLFLQYLYGNSNKLKDSVIDRYYELLLKEGNRRNLRRFVRSVNQPDEILERSLRKLNVPVLIQWGSRDPWLPVDHADRFHRILPDSSLITYLSAGHLPMEEIPKQTAHNAGKFLTDN